MPQLQLPIFPAGSTHITPTQAFECREERVAYFHGQLPVFVHAEDDARTFRLITSHLVVNGNATQADIARAFGVTAISVKRAVKTYLLSGPEPGSATESGVTARMARFFYRAPVVRWESGRWTFVRRRDRGRSVRRRPTLSRTSPCRHHNIGLTRPVSRCPGALGALRQFGRYGGPGCSVAPNNAPQDGWGGISAS